MDNPNEQQPKMPSIWKRLLPLGMIIGLSLALYLLGITDYIRFEAIQEHHAYLESFVEEYPLLSIAIYIGSYILMTALSIPGATLLTLLGGLLFPFIWGLLYAVSGATLGAICLFLAAKTALGSSLKSEVRPYLAKFRAGFHDHAASYLLFLRLVPIFPFWLVNLGSAFVGVSLFTFAWTTFIGIMPGAFVYIQAGAGLREILERGQEFSLMTLLNLHTRIALIGLGLLALLPILVKQWPQIKSYWKKPII